MGGHKLTVGHEFIFKSFVILRLYFHAHLDNTLKIRGGTEQIHFAQQNRGKVDVIFNARIRTR